MRIIILILAYFICLVPSSYATLTATIVPVDKVGGANPQLQNGSMTDTGTASGAGNVGIGSSTPGSQLDVNGTTRIFGLVGVSVVNPGQALDVTGTIRSSSGFISTGGNTGIGSSNPGMQLDVNGTVRAVQLAIRGGTSSMFLKGDGSTDSSTYLSGNQTITLSSDVTGSGTTAITTTLKNTGTAGTYRSTTFDAQGRETSGTNPTTFSGYGISDSSANLRSALTDSTGTGVTVFGTAPHLTGNVGINNASPITALDVNGTVRATGLDVEGTASITGLLSTNVTPSKVVVTNSNGQLIAASNVTDTAYSTAVGANPTATVGTAAVNGASANFMRADGAPAINLTMSPTWTGNHTFAPSSGNTVFTAGNVGINSATPGSFLDVQGTERLFGTGNTLDVQGTVRTQGFTLTGNGAASGYILQTSSGVGVGTWVPEPSGGGSGTVNSGTANQAAYYATSGTAVSGTSTLIINGGNVGVGTTIPIDYFTTITPNSGGISINANPTPNGIDSNTYTLLHLNNNVTDSASTPFTYTNSGVTFSNVSPEFIGVYYGVFGGSADLVTTTNFTTFNSTSTWTDDFWLEPSNTSNINRIFDISSDGNTNNIIRLVQVGSTSFTGHGITNAIYFNVYTSASEALTFTAPWTPITGAWTHIVVQRNSTANSSSAWSVYINGVAKTLTLVAGAWNASITNAAAVMYVGTDNGSNFLQGNLGEFRVSTIARYASNFTPNNFPYNLGVGTPAFSLYNNNALLSKFWNDGFNGNAAKIDVNSNTVVTLTTAGNVGIGSLVPGTALDVNGTVRGTGFSGPGIVPTGVANQVAYWAAANQTLSGSNNLIFNGTNVGIGSAAPGTPLDVQGSIRAFSAGNTLDVFGTVRTQGFTLTGNGASSGYVLTSNGSTGIGTWAPATGGGGGSGTVNSGNVGNATYYGSTGTAVNGTATVYYPLNGNVGINQTTAVKALDVNGTVRMTGFMLPNGAVNGYGLTTNGSGNGSWNVVGSGNVNSGTLNQFAFYSSTGTSVNGTTNLIQNNNGNIGIGSPTPGVQLDVNGTMRGFLQSAGGFFAPNATLAPISGTLFEVQGTLNQTEILTNGNMGIGTTTTSNLLQVGAPGAVGNVGIETVSPNATLDVEGTLYPVVFGAVTSPTLGAVQNVGIGTFSPGQFLDVQGTVRAVKFIGFGGVTVLGANVGIGSTNPGQVLDVQGTVRGLLSGACSYLYKCVGGVDSGVIQTSVCGLCPGGSCTQMAGCF